MATAELCSLARYILHRSGPMTAMKLQKLVYYAQAWALVWDEKPLFSDEIQAWANGPVCPPLYDLHRGQFEVRVDSLFPNESSIEAPVLDDWKKETIDEVLKFYGNHSSQWLGELTHLEAPWKDAREGIPSGERGTKEITHAAMAEYYGSLSDRGVP